MNKSNFIQKACLLWLTFIFSFGLGIFVVKRECWPYSIVEETLNFFSGHKESNVSLVGKILNDLNIDPARHMTESNPAPVDEGRTYVNLKGLPIQSRCHPQVYLSEKAPKGYRAIYGTFQFEESLHGVVLLDPDGKVINSWAVSQEDSKGKEYGWNYSPDKFVFPHGFIIGKDASIVVSYDAGGSLTKYDWDGNIVWQHFNTYNHCISFEDDSNIWAYQGTYFVKLDYESGKIIKRFSLDELMGANKHIDIFGIRTKDSVDSFEWEDDPLHVNDIDPLPEHLAHLYPGFNAGDLMISMRSVNLVCVIDQDTLRVKWWRQGLGRRQHDPEWSDHASIYIFNNNMHREHSNILELDPFTYRWEVALDGKDYDFYTWNRGKLQVLDDKGLLISSPNQGKVFEIDKNGEITFEFINNYNNKKNLSISEAVFLDSDYFTKKPSAKN